MRDHDGSLAEGDGFGARRLALADALVGLLGARGAVEPVPDEAHAASLHTEHRAAYDEAEPHEWALIRRAWPDGERSALVEVLHRVSRNLGPRRVWLLVHRHEPQAVPLDSETVLDNPLGFAAGAGDELRLLDQDVAAGLTLARRADPEGGVALELAVWGEPWLSATTRALRDPR